MGFAKLAVPVLNQIIRPVTRKWHRKSQEGAFEVPEECERFRAELATLQQDLRAYTRLLAEMAEVEDLTEIQAE